MISVKLSLECFLTVHVVADAYLQRTGAEIDVGECKMSDLLNRLRERGDREHYLGTQNYVPSMRAEFTKEGDLFHKAADHIATLEAQLAAADRLLNLHEQIAAYRAIRGGVK